MRRALLTLALCLATGAARACQTALLLSIDVSNSIDPGEYRLQIDGLADALSDPEISEILIRDRVALAVQQWSGADKQVISIPWTRMNSLPDVAGFAARARGLERAFVLSNTAPADALSHALRQFSEVQDCTRKVIDVSGDGTANSGGEVREVRRQAQRRGITINGIAIEGLGVAITNYYRQSIITRDGFVMTARGHRDYPRAIKAKILREISRISS